MQVLEDLDGAFLRDLLDPLDELFALHRVHLAHAGKMLRRESRDAPEAEVLPGRAHGIADGKNPGIKYPDDVPRPGFTDDMPLVRHHLLRLGKPLLPVGLHVIDFHIGVVVSGYDAHECNPVPVVPVHIGLDLKHKSREIMVDRIDPALVRHPRKRRARHPQEMLKEGLHTEIGQRRPEKERGNVSPVHRFLVKFHRSAVKQLDLFHQVVPLPGTHMLKYGRIIDIHFQGFAFLCPFLRVAEQEHLPGIAVVYAPEAFAGTDRPVDRTAGNSQLMLDFIRELK